MDSRLTSLIEYVHANAAADFTACRGKDCPKYGANYWCDCESCALDTEEALTGIEEKLLECLESIAS